MTVPTDATPNGLPPFGQYARNLTAEPLWENVTPPAVTFDASNPEYPVKVVAGGEEFGYTPEEALDLAVRLMEVANDARGVPRG